jgi:hypothetical protein
MGQQLDYFRVAIARYGRVAEQALIHRRYGSRISLGHIAMAELAGDPRLFNVDRVGKGNGLVRSTRAESEKGSSPPGTEDKDQYQNYYDRYQQANDS